MQKEDNKKDNCKVFRVKRKRNQRQYLFFFNSNFRNFNILLFSAIFPSDSKTADVQPVSKKKDKTEIDNYRHVGIKTTFWKVYCMIKSKNQAFKRYMHDQMYAYFYPFLYISQCGFRQGYNMETCLLVMIEQERKSVDDGRLSGAVVTGQSNASDCINHWLTNRKARSI